MRLLRSLMASALSALILAATLASPAAAPAVQRALAEPVRPVPLGPGLAAPRASGDVFGYLPCWEVDDGTDAYLRYDLLSTIALFGVAFRPDGSFNTTDAGYTMVTGSRAATILQHAHAAGTRVVVSFESFNATKNAQFLGDTDGQATFISNAVALVTRLGADGMNIDIEGLSGSYFDEFGTFIGRLRAAAVAANPAAQVSVATNASTSGARMAAQAIQNGADRAFIMGYAYRTAGSDPVGSPAPLVRSDGGPSLTRTLDLYVAEGVPVDRTILGLPYYGTTWPTDGPELHAPRGDGSAANFFPSSLVGAPTGASLSYDGVEHAAVMTWWDASKKTWMQTYYDDPASLAPKFQLALRRGLAGVGIWALGYDKGLPGYWQLIASLRRAPELSIASATRASTASTSVKLKIGWKSAGSPVTQVRLANAPGAWSSWRRSAATLSWKIPAGADGLRTVYIQARDASGRLTTVRAVDVVYDRHGPVVSTLSLAWSTGSKRWVARFYAEDVSPIASYSFRYRVGTGAWRYLTRGPDDNLVRIGVPHSAHVTVQVRAKDTAGHWGAWASVARP